MTALCSPDRREGFLVHGPLLWREAIQGGIIRQRSDGLLHRPSR